MQILQGGLENVPGFLFSAVKCGIRYNDRLDYSLIVSEKPCNAAGVFTTNKISAPPVKLCRERINNPIKAILINSDNANACTGEEGYNITTALISDIALRLNTPPGSIVMASTGIIGHRLPSEKMMGSHSELVNSLSPDNGRLVPEAIMTTDTIPKKISVSFETGRGEYVIGGTIKGSGMIAPNMATLLSFIITDAPVSRDDLNIIFKKIINSTLNSLTIDGDMSTNDTAVILSPISDNSIKNKDLNNFEEALNTVLMKLAEMLIMDAEGATKFVKIIVKGAVNDEDAVKAARAVSESLLVKTAFFGKDPNWGRIAVSAGYSGAEINESKLSIYLGEITLLQNGVPVEFDKNRIEHLLSNRQFQVTVDIGLGDGKAQMNTCDISYKYVEINSEYST